MFSANSGSGLNTYRNVGVESLATAATPHRLVLMLFDGACAAIAQAKGQLERHEIEAKGRSISQAISIIDGGLKASLDLKVGGEMAQNLSDLYVYIGERLFHANLKNDSAALDEAATLLEQLGDAWRSIGAKPAAAAAGAVPVTQAPQFYSAPAAPAKTNRAPAPAQTYRAPAAAAPAPEAAVAPAPAPATTPAPQNRTAFGAAKTYAATPPIQMRTGSAATAAPTAPAASAAPNNAATQSRRLAAVYGSL